MPRARRSARTVSLCTRSPKTVSGSCCDCFKARAMASRTPKHIPKCSARRILIRLLRTRLHFVLQSIGLPRLSSVQTFCAWPQPRYFMVPIGRVTPCAYPFSVERGWPSRSRPECRIRDDYSRKPTRCGWASRAPLNTYPCAPGACGAHGDAACLASLWPPQSKGELFGLSPSLLLTIFELHDLAAVHPLTVTSLSPHRYLPVVPLIGY